MSYKMLSLAESALNRVPFYGTSSTKVILTSLLIIPDTQLNQI